MLNSEILGEIGEVPPTLLDNLYGSYGYGDVALFSVHNENVHDGSRVLIIKESFADVVYPFFAEAVEYLDVIDLRAFSYSLERYIDKTDPDTVIVIYGTQAFEGESSDSAFDFR